MPAKVLKKTTSQFVKEAIAVHGKRYDYSKSVYLGSGTKLEIVCGEHGSFFQSPNSHVSKGRGCPTCSKEYQKNNPNGKLSSVELLRRFKRAHGKTYDYSNSDLTCGITGKIEIVCRKHGPFIQHAGTHASGSGCPKCFESIRGSNLVVPFSEFVKRAKAVHGNRYLYDLEAYRSYTEHTTIVCTRHGPFRQKPFQHCYAGNGCPVCAGKAPTTVDSFIKAAQVVHGTKYDYSKVSISGNNKQPVEIICKKHGSFWQSPNNHVSKRQDCPQCTKIYAVSKVEKRVARWLSRHCRVETSVRGLLARKELDIYCPDQRVAIEINGVYWHSEKFQDFDHLYLKTQECKAQSITLLHFWDFEIHSRSSAVQNLILAKLNLNSTVYARKCSIVSLSASDYSPFLNKYHLQGSIGAKYAFGLMLQDELLAVMTFGHSRFADAGFEILRFACKASVSIVGGASRLFKHFIKQVDPASVVSYADLRFSEGQLYNALGFKYVRRSRPSYFWSNGHERLSRFQAQKHRLASFLPNFDNSKSESENMRAAGWVKVFDAGTLTYIWTKQC